MKSILVVEDEHAIADLLVEILQEEGYLVSRVRNGFEALRFMESGRPDLVLSDVMMPGLDGEELCRRIKAMDGALPVILVTASPRAIGAACGYDVLLRKPFDLDTIIQTVERLLL